jgi:hypothetical protein
MPFRAAASEKLSGSPDDVNPADAPFQRMDSSKMPDLPYLFPKEDYGTPWVPPADFSKDKIQPFFGPWDNGPAPEKTITRPFVSCAGFTFMFVRVLPSCLFAAILDVTRHRRG